MSLWSRLANVFRPDRAEREIDDELRSHLSEALDHGRDPAEARRALGSTLRMREESRDIKLIPWLDSLRADAVFGWRQIAKRKVTSAAAILSLALAIGSCTSAFRLIDALLLRPLPVKDPQLLYEVARQGEFAGKIVTVDNWAYPSFRLMRDAVRDQAQLIAVSDAQRVDLTYQSDQEMEKGNVQYVSGSMFDTFGLRPSLGRLFTADDDVKPGAHPVAVISYDYWARRFGRDANIIGKGFRLGSASTFASPSRDEFRIIGVAPEPFTGTERGTVTDIFLPSMMHPGAIRDDWTWHRTLAYIHPGVALDPLREKLNATSLAFERERAKGFSGMSRENIEKYLAQKVVLEPAAAGASGLQADYRRSLLALAVLVGLVLLIACANVANLMTAQAAARAREMALRVSIGAGRFRLVQMVLIESAWLGFLAAAAGGWFAWWAAPFVVGRINPPDNPARLALPADWRVLFFGLALAVAVTLLFGLAPALRASSIKPASALKGDSDPHSRRRLMHALIAVQVAFCFLVIFVAGLFVATFDRLSHRPIGFTAEGVLLIDTVAPRAESPVYWTQAADRLRETGGVESAAVSGWPLLGGNDWNGFVSVNGAPPGPVLANFLDVSPGWLNAMKIPLLDGRDFRPAETGAAIINQTFAREYFGAENPIGKWFAKGSARYDVIGIARDAPYRNLREPIPPVAYVPLRDLRTATIVVRTTPNPLALAPILRREVPRARPEFRVSNLRTQADLVRAQTIRERLLAMLALFFAAVALLLAGIGLYGVLDYSVIQRRREIGIRMAIGARAGGIIRGVTAEVFAMVLVGAVAGLALGAISARYIESLLYQVRPGDPMLLALPAGAIFAAVLIAALPAAIRAVRIDPIQVLRSE